MNEEQNYIVTRNYEVSITLHGHYTVQDYNCPPGWLGSGCYDKDFPMTISATADVWAENESEARRLAEHFDYEKDPNNPFSFIQDEDVEILSVEATGGVSDDPDEEVSCVYYNYD